MTRVVSILVLVWLIGLAYAQARVAPPLKAVDTPAALEPWKKWVLHDKADQRCPVHFNDAAQRRCWWPSRLAVDVGAQGGLFDLQVTVYAPTWVLLPGGENHWPESVSIDLAEVPVVGRNGFPCIWLEPGEYRVNGAFLWEALPEILRIPAATGLLSLTVNGREILEPDLDPGGRLRLSGSGRAARTEDTMAVTVFRLIEDDIPMRVITRLLLQVSGRARELRLADLLPEAAVVMKIDSPLPARLLSHPIDRDALLIQARPGRWDIRVTVRLRGPVKRLSAGNAPYGEEIWSFKAFNHLRMVNVTGASTLEPSRTRMPDEWKGFPAYLVQSGDALSFDVIRRGDPDPAPDRLSLHRTWWLDFDGTGFTLHDRIGGTLSRTWHLAMETPVMLGRVAVDGSDQLITLQGDGPSPGVQLRRGQLFLEADSRLPRASSTLPVIGWDHDFQQVSGDLHLPPGWRLFSVAGVDVPTGAWLQRWTLLDFFLVLIIAVSTYRIRNRTTGLLALVTLMLIFHEAGAPRLVWLHLLAVVALLKYLPEGWFKKLVRLWGAAAVIALVVISLPFMVQQVRRAVFPQLADRGIAPHPSLPASDRLFEAPKIAALPPSKVVGRTGQAVDRLQTMQKRPETRPARFLPDPDALIQTGPGLPAWQWQAVPLRWNGPVDRSQKMHLWLISPTLNLILGFVRVLLLALLIMAFLDLRHWRRHLPVSLKFGSSALILIVMVLGPVSSLKAESAVGAFPPQPLLDELQRRLLAPPPCLPHCADVSRLELSATPDQLRLIMQVHAQVATAVPLPVTQETWRPNQLDLNNEPVKSLARDDRGNLWLVVPRGVHRIKMTGPTGNIDEIRIAFPIIPHIGTYAGVGWQVRGVRPDGGMDAAISLTRLQTQGKVPAKTRQTDIPTYFQVTRTLHMGIQWETTTHIRRLTEPGEPMVLSIPLIKGASLTTAGIEVTDGMAQIALGPQETQSSFTTTLPITPTIRLTAPREVPWMETWILDAAAIWRCTPSGLPVVHHQNAEQRWQPQWRPWPGEQLTFVISRPEAAAGRTVTIDNVQLELTPGQRGARATLNLAARASQGGQHRIELPALANLQSVRIDGLSLPIRQDGRLVTIPLEPGPQAIDLEWLQLSGAMNQGVSLLKAPEVNLGEAAVNAAVTFHLPDHRWILLTGGPRLGPAVLFWSYAIVVLAVAAGLGRTDITPLGTRQWLLLGLGLTQVPVAVGAIVVGWLLALGYRCRKTPPAGARAFNLIQVLLALLTLAALAGLYTAIEGGLLGIPDMQIGGNHSTRFQLNWFQDRIDGVMPATWVLSLPLWTYHLLMLAWSLWLAFSLIAWLRWGWGCFSQTQPWKPISWRRRSRPQDAPEIEVPPPSP